MRDIADLTVPRGPDDGTQNGPSLFPGTPCPALSLQQVRIAAGEAVVAYLLGRNEPAAAVSTKTTTHVTYENRRCSAIDHTSTTHSS
jgi:hypothetical protein